MRLSQFLLWCENHALDSWPRGYDYLMAKGTSVLRDSDDRPGAGSRADYNFRHARRYTVWMRWRDLLQGAGHPSSRGIPLELWLTIADRHPNSILYTRANSPLHDHLSTALPDSLVEQVAVIHVTDDTEDSRIRLAGMVQEGETIASISTSLPPCRNRIVSTLCPCRSELSEDSLPILHA